MQFILIDYVWLSISVMEEADTSISRVLARSRTPSPVVVSPSCRRRSKSETPTRVTDSSTPAASEEPSSVARSRALLEQEEPNIHEDQNSSILETSGTASTSKQSSRSKTATLLPPIPENAALATTNEVTPEKKRKKPDQKATAAPSPVGSTEKWKEDEEVEETSLARGTKRGRTPSLMDGPLPGGGGRLVDTSTVRITQNGASTPSLDTTLTSEAEAGGSSSSQPKKASCGNTRVPEEEGSSAASRTISHESVDKKVVYGGEDTDCRVKAKAKRRSMSKTRSRSKLAVEPMVRKVKKAVFNFVPCLSIVYEDSDRSVLEATLVEPAGTSASRKNRQKKVVVKLEAEEVSLPQYDEEEEEKPRKRRRQRKETSSTLQEESPESCVTSSTSRTKRSGPYTKRRTRRK
jgi:hypothetical protein